MRVLIFTEGGSHIGLGHITRCISLYDEIESRGIAVELIIYSDIYDIDILKNKNVRIINWLCIDFLIQDIKENDYCIVDSYLADEYLYRVISSRAKQSLFIDDNARINYPKGIIVNPGIGSNNLNYQISNKKTYLLGTDYVILRSSFIGSSRKYINNKVKEILITMGGSDIRNLTPMILRQLCSYYKNILFNVIIGSGFENVNIFNNIKPKNSNFYKNVKANEMKSIMKKSDIAITAAGQTIYELIATKTPFIPIKVVENQRDNILGLIQNNLIDDFLEYRDINLLGKIETQIKNLLEYDNRKKLYNRYNAVIDGLGCKRIIDTLIEQSR